MIRPDSHLRQLIVQATAEQASRAIAKAKEYHAMCYRLGVEPIEPMKVLREAFELELAGIADGADVGKSREDYFTRRQYGRNYTEP